MASLPSEDWIVYGWRYSGHEPLLSTKLSHGEFVGSGAFRICGAHKSLGYGGTAPFSTFGNGCTVPCTILSLVFSPIQLGTLNRDLTLFLTLAFPLSLNPLRFAPFPLCSTQRNPSRPKKEQDTTLLEMLSSLGSK